MQTLNRVEWGASAPDDLDTAPTRQARLNSLEYSQFPSEKIHQVFRYPAKFHPPVARALVESYSKKGDLVRDPFCGSGTLLVEAISAGRVAHGSDVDPLAVLVSRCKTAVLDPELLEKAWKDFGATVDALRASRRTTLDLTFNDLTEEEEEAELGELKIPSIPNMNHWFRRYVQVDLARLKASIQAFKVEDDYRAVLSMVFASILRNTSNADPVPVSGLEVTSHMLKKEQAGRRVDVFDSFATKGRKTIQAIADFNRTRPVGIRAEVALRDARTGVNSEAAATITSPPYQNAVDYYRRHQLEMFWLDLTESQSDRLDLLPQYIGRAQVPSKDHWAKSELDSELEAQWLAEIESTSLKRARAFRAYFASMRAAFDTMSKGTAVNGKIVVVVGRSRWGDVEIPTESLFKALAPTELVLEDHLTYAIVNRHMSYTRHNGANIDSEHVLVFRKGAGNAQ